MPNYTRLLALLIPLIALFVTRIWEPLQTKYTVVGLGRSKASIVNVHGERIVKIPGTALCEDLHYHEPSGKLITACEDQKTGAEARRHWFPPLAHFDEKCAKGQGRLVVIDPMDFTAKHLEFENFNGPFITHGIDILSSSKFQNLVYIFAINHLAHPDASKPTHKGPKASSQIEIFSHTIGTGTARHLYSIAHPSIRTPNDVLALTTTSFLVTNDHHYREGPLRIIEDFGWRGVAGWTDTLHVTLDTIEHATGNASSGVSATTALKGLHNNNGLGRGEADDIVIIGSAASGELTRAKLVSGDAGRVEKGPHLEVLEHIQLDTTIDNPTYFRDRYAVPGNDASGYIVAGLTNAAELANDVHKPDALIPVAVWHVKANASVKWSEGQKQVWEKKLIFQDDGREISGAATAVFLGEDPAKHGGVKKAWLFVTGFASGSVVATLVDL